MNGYVRIGAIVALFTMAAPTSVFAARTSEPAVMVVSSDSVDPYARYTIPGQCRQAAIRLRDEYWRDKRRDLLVYDPALDSVPTPVVRAVRQCATRFSVASVAPRHLLDLAQLYLWTQQDDLAHQAIDRLFATMSSRPATDRGWVRYLWTVRLLHAFPSRLEAARQSLVQLDALGAPVALWRLFAHEQFAEYAVTVNDRRGADAEARAALAASHQMTRDDRVDWVGTIGKAYETLTIPLSLTSPTTALAVLDTAIADLTPLRPDGSPEQARLREGFINDRTPIAAMGKGGFAPLHADRWYGITGDTLRPQRGQMTLLLTLGTSCSGPCYPLFAVINRLHAAFGGRLEIIVLTSTVGYFREQLVPSPMVEADSAGSYYRKFIGLPATIAVENTPFHYIADGRRRNERTRNQQVYGALGRPGVLLDRDGVVRWLGSVEPEQEAMLTAVIREALQ
jgi:hypothetical protein